MTVDENPLSYKTSKVVLVTFSSYPYCYPGLFKKQVSVKVREAPVKVSVKG